MFNDYISMKKLDVDKILERLEQSSTFHLSLGSKELFHSNFLYWLSIVDWNAFMQVARKLAGVERFWWEEQYKRSDNRDENEIEVRRESRNFDLSIHIRVEKERDEDNSSFIKSIWIPVFVLENKMKSLPRQDQLQEYTEKAFRDWKIKKKNNELQKKWEEHPISFVLLSLFVDKKFNIQCDYTYEYGGKNKKAIHVTAIWERHNYKDLFDFLNNVELHHLSSFNQEIIKDYCQFIMALHELAENDWKISPCNCFIETIYPWAMSNYHGDKQVQLRIDDIRQKVHYAQMEAMLKEKLNEAGIEAMYARADKENKAHVRYNTNYAHNIGILEISIRLKGDCAIFIQLQGNSYAHAFCYDKKNAAQELKKRRNSLKSIFDFDKLPAKATKDFIRKTTNYPAELQTNELFPKKENKRAKGSLLDYKYYGKSFIYQHVLIPESVTIEHVLQAMVKDTKKCLSIK